MPSRESVPPGATAKWLAVVGIGEEGVAGLGAAARAAIGDAEIVFGGARHLELAAPLIRGETRCWPSPFDAGAVWALRGRRVCVLASGDPFLHGVGAVLARHVPAGEMAVLPAPSAFSLAAARLGWPLQDTETISLHGRPVELLRPLLHPGRRVVALTSDGSAPAAIARYLTRHGFGPSIVHVLETLGGPDERHSVFTARDICAEEFHPLNVLAIEVAAEQEAAIIPLATPDDALFEHDGQITKQEVRALTLAALSPRRGELLWDIGAGSGSVAIAWMLAHPSLKAVAVETRADRAERIGRNAQNLGVPGLAVIHGEAPAALAGVPAPDAVFLGGGVAASVDTSIEALRPGGRLVANAVTIETETALAALHARLGGTLTRISLSRAEPVGTMTGWRPALPITQWAWTKP